MNKIKTFAVLTAITLSMLCVSCVELAMLALTTNPNEAPTNFVKPKLIKLNSENADQKLVFLDWNNDSPSMDMRNTNSGNGWTGGMRHTPNVYRFFQNKYYGLTLDFKKQTFVETGFDGAQLPEVKGTWTIVR